MSNGTITMRMFGNFGRWGNQLFQRAFLKCYARMYDLDVQLPPWAGNLLLGADDRPVKAHLPPAYEKLSGDNWSHPVPPTGDEFVNKDFRGYAQWNMAWYAPHRDYVRSLMQPAPAIAERLAPAAAKLDSLGHTRVGLHIRRGDYGKHIFYLTPVAWYLDWLAKHWSGFDAPVLFISTETPELVREFAVYNPVTVEDLGVELRAETLPHYCYLRYDRNHPDPRQYDFFPEWYTLTRCEVLVTGNSTFSFTAGMASERLQKFYRSQIPTQSIEEEELWSAFPCQRWHQKDWPNVPGAWLDRNPYWRE